MYGKKTRKKEIYHIYTQDTSLLECSVLHLFLSQYFSPRHTSPPIATIYSSLHTEQDTSALFVLLFPAFQVVFPSFPPLFVLFVKGTTGMTKCEFGLFYIKIKMHLKLLLLPTKQAIT